MMFLGTVYFIQFELVQKGLIDRLEIALFKGKSVSIAGQVNTEGKLFVKDDIPFIVRHHFTIVHLAFAIVPDGSVGGSTVLGQQLHYQEGGKNSQENLMFVLRTRRLRRFCSTHY